MIIDLGLVDVLKFQTEVLELDFNSQEYIVMFFQNEGHEEGQHLIVHALFQTDRSAFDYLLSLTNIEVNPFLQRSLSGQDISDISRTLLHELPDIARHPSFFRDLQLGRIATILDRHDVDLNVRARTGRSPLEHFCHNCTLNFHCDRILLNVVDLYLAWGANVSARALSSIEEASNRFKNRAHSREKMNPNELQKLLIERSSNEIDK